MTLSKHARAVLHALAQGYRVTDTGQVVAPSGEVRAVRRREGHSPYPTFNIAFEGASFPVAAHKLAAAQVFGELALVPGVHVRHRDDNPDNFAPSNLLIGDQSRNEMDKPAATRRRSALAAASKRRVLTAAAARKVVKLSLQGLKGKDIAERLRCSPSTISEILSGKLYSEVTGLTQQARTRNDVPGHVDVRVA